MTATAVVHVVEGVARAERARPGPDEGTLVVGSTVFVVQCVVEYAAEKTAVALLERLSAREARAPPMARPLPPPLDEALLAGDEFVLARRLEGGRAASAPRRARPGRFGDLRLADAQRLWKAGAAAPAAQSETDAHPSCSEEEEDDDDGEGGAEEEEEEEEAISEEAVLDPDDDDDDEAARAASSDDERLSSDDESSVGEDDDGGDSDDFDMNDPDGEAGGAVEEEEEEEEE